MVEGLFRLLRSDYSLPVNLGNPKEISILEFASEIKEIMGATQPIRFEELPVDDPTRRQPDISLAKSLLDWTPTTPRRIGLERTIAYFKSLDPAEWHKKEHRNFSKHNKK